MSLPLNLNYEEFKGIAATGSVVPLILEVFGGSETPVGIYSKVQKEGLDTFLLESAEQGVWSRYSFIGAGARSKVTIEADSVSISGQAVTPNPVSKTNTGLTLVDEIQQSWKQASLENLPPLTSGLVGFFAWDVIREIEQLGEAKSAPYEHPRIQLLLVQDLIVIDHKENRLLLVSNVYCEAGFDVQAEYNAASKRIEKLFELVSKPTSSAFWLSKSAEKLEITSNSSEAEFVSMVNKAKEHVKAGDVFQVVLSQRFEAKTTASPLDVYRALRSLNPSPYMYLLNLSDNNGEFAIVGSSPEALVRVQSGRAVMHPIAGSRPRGSTPKEDQEHAESLLADQKERAEHLMLVDLARNDLLKVSTPESVSVTEFMKIERFSHIMHLVSTVEAELTPDSSVTDVLRATFPAGTLSGAPKPRALEIIENLESSNRGIFGGVVGYMDFSGNADLAIAIRTAFIRDSVARVQAGAGIVLDSDPKAEFQETVNKSKAVLTAIEQANQSFSK